MSPELFKQSKNLFLVFPPGCGGNHVANILSMHPDFEPRYTHDNYYEKMIWNYNNFFGSGPEDSEGCTAHFSDLENLQKKEITEFESKILSSEKPYIFCSHAVEYLISIQTKLIEPFTDRTVCLFSRPNGRNKIVNARMRKGPWFGGEPEEDRFLTTKIPQLYEKEIFSKHIIKSDRDKVFTVDTDLFYTIEGYDYLVEVFKTNLGIELPEICRKLHTQYIEYEIALYGEVDI
jgi:hypothetical protein